MILGSRQWKYPSHDQTGDVLKAQCLSQGVNVQIMEKEIKVILAPWQYCLLAFGRIVLALTALASIGMLTGCALSPGEFLARNSIPVSFAIGTAVFVSFVLWRIYDNLKEGYRWLQNKRGLKWLPRIKSEDRALPREGPGCSGNVSPENAGVIKKLIDEKAFKEVNVDQKIFEGIVNVPVKVFVLTKQVPRAPPGGFIWDRLFTLNKITTLEIYYSSQRVYKRNKDLIVEDAYHGFIENRWLANPRNKLTPLAPAQAHTKAAQKTAKRFPQSASRIAARFVQPPLWERWRRLCDVIESELKDRRNIMEVSAELQEKIRQLKNGENISGLRVFLRSWEIRRGYMTKRSSVLIGI